MKINLKLSERQTHLNEESLAFYIDALRENRKPLLADNLLLHVENCCECRNKIIDIFSFLQNPDASEKPSPLPRLFPAENKFPGTRRWFLWPGRIAALFAVFFLLAIFFIVNKNDIANSNALPNIAQQHNESGAKIIKKNQPQFPPVKSSQAAQPTNASPKKIANQENKTQSAFSINPNLEHMVNSKSRSFIIQVQSPVNNSSLSEKILFAWSQFTKEAINLIIVSNRNEIVFSSLVNDNQLEFKGTLLSPGLYYWKLESSNELFYIGKFIIADQTTRPK